MRQWHHSSVARKIGLRHPIIQGPFGGGLSSARLAAEVSNLGGLGSYGAQGLAPDRIREVASEIRKLTDRPFAMNLWVSTEDPGASDVTEVQFAAAFQPLLPFYEALEMEPPTFEPSLPVRFEDQFRALVDAKVPVFSFVFDVPDADLLAECRSRGIVTLGAATTVEEAVALEAAGVDIVVASGCEAGGHRPSFLHTAESSLMGTFTLIPQVADAVSIPVVAAGGIADGRGVMAALALGAQGVQVGTAFLACEESGAAPVHREALFGFENRRTVLTRAFSGRLARGLANTLAQHLEISQALILPYPVQSNLLRGLRQAAAANHREDLMQMWSGQVAPLLRHHRARDLFEGLVMEVEALLAKAAL